MTMEPGTSFYFPTHYYIKGQRLADVTSYLYREISPELAARCRYTGDISWLKDEDCLVAIFIDPVTDRFYGQPV